MSNERQVDARDGENGILILVLLILLILGGIGAGAFWFLGQRRQAAVQTEIQAMKAERAAREAAKAAADVQRKKTTP
jgi:uncharacterized protein HemX